MSSSGARIGRWCARSDRNPITGEAMTRELTEEEVEFTVECLTEDVDYHGNCSAIDEETDRAAEEWIAEQLEQGNEWAWCMVRVTAKWEDFVGTAYLGGCSYEDEESFKEGGYYDDLRAEALNDLNQQIADTADKLKALED